MRVCRAGRAKVVKHGPRVILVVLAFAVSGCVPRSGNDGPAAVADGGPSHPFAIGVVDAETGRGVPLVELKTTNDICYYTDSNGLVAFREPGLMGTRVHFTVASP